MITIQTCMHTNKRSINTSGMLEGKDSLRNIGSITTEGPYWWGDSTILGTQRRRKREGQATTRP
jgi:hypothetical protein